MIVGEQHHVVIESLANSGDGVGRINDLVVFIPFSSPGDKLLVQITQKKKTFLKAKIVDIISPSQERVQAPCRVFGKCGGCDWQHIPYAEQLKWKKKNLSDTFKKIGAFTDVSFIDDVKPNSSEYGYRNRIQVHFSNNRFHYFEKNSHKPVVIKDCLLASPIINNFLKNPPNKMKSGKVEIAEVDTDVKAFKVNKEGFSDLGFRQVNTEQNQKLVDFTIDFIMQHSINTIYDLYCGQGNWSIAINNTVPEATCIGIDIDPINIKKAKVFENENLKFLLGSVDKLFKKQELAADLVILDPPRSGCDEDLLRTLTELKVPHLVYVSCHPATLARDLKLLTSLGWSLEKVKPVDMFPQTAHLESWCLLHSAR